MRVGGAVMRRFGKALTLYGGISINYIRSTSDQSEDERTESRFGSTPPQVVFRQSNFGITTKAWVLQLPAGAEYEFSKSLVFRGGIMPQYLSVTSTVDLRRTTVVSPSTSTYRSTNADRRKTLSFIATIGVSLYDDEIGEMHLAYGAAPNGVRSGRCRCGSFRDIGRRPDKRFRAGGSGIDFTCARSNPSHWLRQEPALRVGSRIHEAWCSHRA